MRDVAQLVGVSATTVSLALRRDPSISEHTRRRVLAAQEKLGYTVNRHARELVSRARGNGGRPPLEQLAFCLVDVEQMFDNPSYLPFLQGIESECRTRHLRLFLQSVNPDDPQAVTSSLGGGHADGIILSGRIDDAILKNFLRLDIPIVVLGNYRLQPPVSRVELDLRRAGAQLADHLVGRGHRQIAMVVEQMRGIFEHDIAWGIRERLEQSGLTWSDAQRIVAGRYHAPGAALIAPLLQMEPRPTGIITVDPQVADKCATELVQRGIHVPEEIEIVSLTAIARSPRGHPYRALNARTDRCGRLAVKHLADLAEEPAPELCTSVVSDFEWIEIEKESETPNRLANQPDQP
jgi:LacI family transcriptional regulator